jgi:hypothetical protein
MHTKYWSEILKERGDGEDSHRWEDNNRMDLKEIRWIVVSWIHMA